jgi:hypothetical protein
LLRCNNTWQLFDDLRFLGFLPTMNFQLSQLPMIVGSGRVKFDAPFFLVRSF